MDAETRNAFAATRAEMQAEMRAGFARIDGYFEMMRLQHIDAQRRVEQGFSDVDRRFSIVDARLSSIEADASGFRNEFRQFRDWSTSNIGGVRTSIAELMRRIETIEG